MNQNTQQISINEIKVIDLTIDVYLWVSESLNSAEIGLLGQRIIDLSLRRAADIELTYRYRSESFSEDDAHLQDYNLQEHINHE